MSARRLCGFLIVVVLLSLVGRGRISSGANVPDQRQQTASAVASHLQFPIIIDHTTSDLEQIPEYWIRQAKKDLRVAYGHTSHGSQPITGMAVLQADPSNGGLYDFVRGGETISGALSIADSTPSGDLGNPDRVTWEQRTRDYLNSTGSDRNVMIWSWCGQASSATEADIQTYLDLMSGLERDFPHVTFVYMTGHLDGSGVDGNLNQRNEQIRQHCRDNDRVLFDFADIESYDPDGAYFLDRGADDGCVYQGGNWAQEWCAANPSDALCTACSCAHSEPLNCNLKARAFWWMMARLAGWVVRLAIRLTSHPRPKRYQAPLPVTANSSPTLSRFAALQGRSPLRSERRIAFLRACSICRVRLRLLRAALTTRRRLSCNGCVF